MCSGMLKIGLLLIDYRPMPHKVTLQECAVPTYKPHVAVQEKRRGKLTQVLLVLHDNASAHRSHVIVLPFQKVNKVVCVGLVTVLECGFEVFKLKKCTVHHNLMTFPSLLSPDQTRLPSVSKFTKNFDR